MIFVKRFRPALQWIHTLFTQVSRNADDLCLGRWFPLTCRLHEPIFVVRCDAAPSGMGAILFKRDKAVEYWADVITPDDVAFLRAQLESLWQPEFEMLAILVSLRVWSSYLQFHSVNVHGDALAALYAAEKGSSRSPAMHFLAGEIGLLCEMQSMTLTCKHVPEACNIEAGCLSRLAEGKHIPHSLHDAVRIHVPLVANPFYLQPQ